MIKTIYTDPGTIDQGWEKQRANQVYTDFLEERKSL